MIVETTGLADPVPILATIASDLVCGVASEWAT